MSPLRARAIRAGARLADTRVNLQATGAIPTQAVTDIVGIVEASPGSSPVIALLQRLIDSSSVHRRPSRVDLATAEDAVAQLLGRDDVRTGAWLETARIAAANRDSAFFASIPSRDAADRLTGLPRITPRTASDWEALRDVLTGLLQAAAR